MATYDKMTPASGVGTSAVFGTSLQCHRGWLLFLGIVQVVSGVLALTIPVAASLAAAILFGAVLLVTGIAQLMHAFSARAWKGMVLQALGGLLYTVAALIILALPISGVLTLSIILGVLLVADGVVRCTLAYRLRPREGWGWFVTGGIASLIVGSMLLLGWPLAGLWAIGILLGVNLLFSGITNSSLAVALRSRQARDPARAPFQHSGPKI